MTKLTPVQMKEVNGILWRKILSATLIILALLGGIFGVSLWRIYSKINNNVENLIAKQFEEPRIQETLNNVAETKAEILLVEQIKPEVENFKAEVQSQLDEIRKIVASIKELKSNSDSNAKQIERVLSSIQKSEQEIETFKKAIVGLHSDLVKIERGIVEIQYLTYISRNKLGKNPYEERIEQKLNEILNIAIPNSQERSKFVEELKAYQPPEQ